MRQPFLPLSLRWGGACGWSDCGAASERGEGGGGDAQGLSCMYVCMCEGVGWWKW